MGISDNAVAATFSVTGLSDELHVMEFSGEEGISRLYRFDLTVGCASKKLAFDKVIGQTGVLTVQRGESTPRHLHAMVSEVEQRETLTLAGSSTSWTQYRMVLVPRAWRLLHRTDCRIFQNQGIHAIIKGVLDAGGIDHQMHHKGGTLPANREYCVQYRESDWHFVARLLEEEGYDFWFEHSASQHILHMGNDFQFHPDISGETTIPFHGPDTMAPGEEHVYRLALRERVRPGKVTLNDWNFEKTTLPMLKQKAAELDADLELYDYPGLYDDPKTGETLVGRRLEEARLEQRVAEGESDCIRFCPGFEVTLSGFGRDDFDGKEQVLTEVRHQGTKQAQALDAGVLDPRLTYRNRFCCIARTVPYRPPRLTRKPVVQGPQTAIVVGPDNQEIYTDKHGRVKVHFHWDRLGQKKEKDSCWVRVSQLWAGAGWGAMWIPRIGQEVVVDFLEGDPDRPIITGRVYHGQNVPPYTLPDEKTKSTIKSNSTPGGGGSNEIRFEDKKGAEELYTHAQRDQNERMEHDLSTSVGNNQSLSVGNDQSVSVGHDRTLTVKNNETITIEKGNRVRTVKTGNDMLEVTTGTQTVTVKGDTALNVTTGNRNVTVDTGGYHLNVKNGHTVQVATGGQGFTITSGDHSVSIISGSGSMKASGGITITAGDKVIVIGTNEVQISGAKVVVSGTQEVQVGVGASAIVVNAQGVAISGPKISSTAVGLHEISGALIKIN